ncbi:MAG: hypothetical protein RLZZ416_45 [Candidatus Parcubacteria bacterium]|jgi:hypothetical protein
MMRGNMTDEFRLRDAAAFGEGARLRRKFETLSLAVRVGSLRNVVNGDRE